jgi:hypothetical protein
MEKVPPPTRSNRQIERQRKKKLTTNATINPMLKLINTCISILSMYSTMDSSLLMDLIPMNLSDDDDDASSCRCVIRS